MSTRAFRKLHGTELPPTVNNVPDNDETSEEEEDSIVPVSKGKKKRNKAKNVEALNNPFDLLNESDDTIKDLEASVIESASQPSDSTDHVTEAASSGDGGTRKKKKKKKKNKKNSANQDSVAAETQLEDEIDASIREVNEILGEASFKVTSARDSHPGEFKNLLNVEHKNLNAVNEMRRRFGSRVVQTDNPPHGNPRQRNRVMRKTTFLVQAKDTWPHLSKTGLSMSLVDNSSGGASRSNCMYFTFEHNKEYRKAQMEFLESVESLNAQNIINLTSLHPSHIDTLLQVSEIFKMSDDAAMATDFLERALYVFECAFHPLFSLAQGTARLDFRKQENRPFYMALFRHLHYVGNKGCYRTALEFCKLLLSLDPDGDPMCVVLLVDFYAIRSEQYSFLVQLSEEWEGHRNLSQLPNFAYSVPLAMFHQSTADCSSYTKADSLLQEALMTFPSMLQPLLDKCNIAPDARVQGHPFFGTEADFKQPKPLKQLVMLYVGRCHSCWKDPDVVAWLERNVQQVLDKVDSEDPVVAQNLNRHHVKFQGTPRNIHRHIMISDIKEASSALPPELAHTPVMSYDPLPPTDAIVSYDRPERRRRVDQGSNPLAMFFQSLMPNFNPQEVLEEPAPGAVGGAEGQNFREGVTRVMDAMRDLLNNIRPVPPPLENGENQDDEQDDPGFEDHEWD